jgi:hypothetical protein
MKLFGERIEKLFRVAVHPDCLGYANKALESRLKRGNCEHLRSVPHDPAPP